MKICSRFLTLTTIIIALLSSIQAFCAETPPSYTLGAGDRIHISVFGEDDLTMDVVIAETGKIKYPFLGEIQVAGLTTVELDQRITRGLKGPYLVNPDVIVSILEYRPFYVYGEVNDPGSFQYRPGISVGHAVALAGGFTERANRDRILVVRNDKQLNKRYSQPIELHDLVRAGDLITVKRSFF